MRKLDPKQICIDFEGEMTALILFLEDIVGSLEDKGASDERLATLSELTFHRGYVAFESFVSALFIGCINKDASVFLNHEWDRIKASISQKFTPDHAGRITFHVAKHLRASEIESLVNPDGANITFTSSSLMITRANEWLPSRFSAKFAALARENLLLIDTARLLRNCIAHQSQRSFKEMNDALTSLPATGVLRSLRRQNRIFNIGAYLKADVGGKGRIHVFLEEFKGIAGKLQ